MFDGKVKGTFHILRKRRFCLALDVILGGGGGGVVG
jgi:hypothetical protein